MASSNDMDDLILNFSSGVRVSERSLFAATKVSNNNTIVSDILKSLATENVDDYLEVLNKGIPYELKQVDKSSAEYCRIDSSYTATLNHVRDMWLIIKIDKILCPYLLAAFLLIEQKKQANHASITKSSLYHGTYARNIPSICTNNFNWRLRGSCKGHIFGCGMSFAKRSTYACHYPNVCLDHPRTLFLAQVMTTNITLGTQCTIVPPEGYDATGKVNLDVIVKYDDAEFFPQYIIYYDVLKSWNFHTFSILDD